MKGIRNRQQNKERRKVDAQQKTLSDECEVVLTCWNVLVLSYLPFVTLLSFSSFISFLPWNVCKHVSISRGNKESERGRTSKRKSKKKEQAKDNESWEQEEAKYDAEDSTRSDKEWIRQVREGQGRINQPTLIAWSLFRSCTHWASACSFCALCPSIAAPRAEMQLLSAIFPLPTEMKKPGNKKRKDKVKQKHAGSESDWARKHKKWDDRKKELEEGIRTGSRGQLTQYKNENKTKQTKEKHEWRSAKICLSETGSLLWVTSETDRGRDETSWTKKEAHKYKKWSKPWNRNQ